MTRNMLRLPVRVRPPIEGKQALGKPLLSMSVELCRFEFPKPFHLKCYSLILFTLSYLHISILNFQGYMSDVPTTSNHHHHRRSSSSHRRSSRSALRPSRPETPLILSSFKPIPSISQPTPEEIQRDVDIVFHNMGLDSASPIRHIPHSQTLTSIHDANHEVIGDNIVDEEEVDDVDMTEEELRRELERETN